MNPDKIPTSLHNLIALAEKWGIGDDFEREKVLTNATDNELETLCHCLDYANENDLFNWLAGPESFLPNPSPEYLAFTCLTMAIDSSKVKLQHRNMSMV